MFRFALAAIAATVLGVSAQAAPLKIGSEMPQFAGLECAVSGKSCSAADLKDKDVIVLCVTCNHCPIAVMYEDRLVKFGKDFAGKDGKVAFLAVNVSNMDADKIDKMKERSKEKGYTFGYLYDPSQKIAKDLGASKTPEFFVFDKNRRLVYTGALDDNNNAEKVSKHYVEDAVKAALKGETPSTQTTTARGCGIAWDKK